MTRAMKKIINRNRYKITLKLYTENKRTKKAHLETIG